MSQPAASQKVIRATIADLDALTPLFDGYRQFYEQPSAPEQARTFLDERLGRQDSVIFLARVESGEPQGFTQLYPVFSSIRTARVWLLNDLYVAPRARRQGVAEALIGAATAFAREDGAACMTLSTALDNSSAQRLYQRLGWQREEGFVEYALTL